ncbi:hypothetical protein KGY79_03475 [Candidatus Bipolaricaulota bacterium]|nr:hypothetical protein [Candidatus Bipolaricaulota bacterium]
MVPLIIGTSAYIIAGILSLTYSRRKFWFSLLGWTGGLAGLVTGVLIYGRVGSLVSSLGRWGALGVEIRLDETTLLFVALIVVLNFFTLTYLKGRRDGTFYCLYNFFLAASYSVAFSNDLFNLYVTIELMSLISILLIGYDRKPYQIYAGIKYLLISSLSMSLYFIGLSFVYGAGGHLGIQELVEKLGGKTSLGLSVGLGLMLTGLAVKGGVFLFSMWLPDAYSYSGTVVSVLLAGIGTKAGIIGIIRMTALTGWTNLLLGLGAMTGILGAALAVVNRRPKRILAFSSISQVGYILIAVGIGTPAGLVVASLYIFFHGLFKSLLFLSVGYAGVGSEDTSLDRVNAVPIASKVGIVVGSLSIMAIPPFNGYFVKSLLLESAGYEWVQWSILVIGFGTVIYSLDLIRSFLIDPSAGNFGIRSFSVLGFSGTVALSTVSVWFIFGRGPMLNLLIPYHVLVSFGLFAAGGLVYLGLRSQLEKYEFPAFPFDLDNSLISLFTGLLVVVSGMLLI